MIKIYNILKEKVLKLATAESCTGGMVASHIVNFEGISEVFKGGVVAYNNDIKTKVLKVDKNLLENKGPYNHDTAIQMAIGISKLMDADVTVSTTGLTPTSRKAIYEGDIFIAVYIHNQDDILIKSKGTYVDPSLPRNEWRIQATKVAIDFLQEILMEVYNEER